MSYASSIANTLCCLRTGYNPRRKNADLIYPHIFWKVIVQLKSGHDILLLQKTLTFVAES